MACDAIWTFKSPEHLIVSYEQGSTSFYWSFCDVYFDDILICSVN